MIKAGVFTADEYEFAQRVAEVGLAGAQEAEKSLPGSTTSNDDNSGGGGSGGSSGSSSGGNPDKNETEDIPLF